MTETARTYLKQLRADSKKSMQEVAEAFGITRQYYEMIENGERQKKMDLALIVKIADFFGVPLEQVAEYEKLRMEAGDHGNTDHQSNEAAADAAGT